MFRLGYNTNGLPHHRVEDALQLCAELGYVAVALTPDAGLLDPFRLGSDEVARVRREAEALGLALTVETGSRFLLDPRRKHFPTLLEEQASDRARRVDFLNRCIDLAAELGAEGMSFWAGSAPEGRRAEASATEADWDHLVEGTGAVLAHGREQQVEVHFEPEPGMFIERPAGYLELVRRLGADGSDLNLCLDVGHCLVTGDLPVAQVIRDLAPRLGMVHLDDIAGGLHVHRMFGEGDLDLKETVSALIEVGYSGVAAVELSRDGHRGPEAAGEAMGHIRRALGTP
ncbi:MAG: L-ribulose-5-phosphate 3-epimerase [Planctomycetota bacterium]|jgi:L-ribulose-5-phosphate 3-epimerase